MYEHIDGDTIVHSTLESGKDLIVKDQWKREYHFKIASFPVPTGLASEAIEFLGETTFEELQNDRKPAALN